MSKSLGPRPHPDHLREQAKDLLTAHRNGDPDALVRFQQGLPAPKPEMLALHDAQSVIAREYGFASWTRLLRHVEELRALVGITPKIESDYVDAALESDLGRFRRLRELYPGIARYSPATALVSAELGIVESLDATIKLPPRGYAPIEYVCYSRIGRIEPDRHQTQVDCARDLLDRGAEPNTYLLYGPQQHKIPVLFGAAAEAGHVGLVRLLIERGAEVNDGESVFHAAEHSYFDVLKELVAHGADISGRHAGYGNTPLYFLCSFPEDYRTAGREGIRWLLEHGADPNVPSTERRETPLMALAGATFDLDLVRLLLDHGADPIQADAHGVSAYQTAVAGGNQPVVQLFESRGFRQEVTPEQVFLHACGTNDASEIQRLIGDHPEWLTSLAEAADKLMKSFAATNRAEGIRGLLAAGFPPAGSIATSPLHDACYPGWLEAARVLVEAGAPLDRLDDEWESTPLGWALHGSVFRNNPSGDYPAVVELLLNHGASQEEARARLAEMEGLRPEVVAVLRQKIGE